MIAAEPVAVAVAVEPTPMALLRRLAVEVYADLGISDAALEAYLQKIQSAELGQLALRHGALVLLHEAMRARRRPGGKLSMLSSGGAGEWTEEDRAMETILAAEWPLAGGKYVRDANEGELVEDAAMNRVMALGNTLAARFKEAIVEARRAAGVPADERTGAKLSDAQIQVIYESIYGRLEG